MLVVLFLLSKQAFANYYVLVAGLLMIGTVLATHDDDRDPETM